MSSTATTVNNSSSSTRKRKSAFRPSSSGRKKSTPTLDSVRDIEINGKEDDDVTGATQENGNAVEAPGKNENGTPDGADMGTVANNRHFNQEPADETMVVITSSTKATSPPAPHSGPRRRSRRSITVGPPPVSATTPTTAASGSGADYQEAAHATAASAAIAPPLGTITTTISTKILQPESAGAPTLKTFCSQFRVKKAKSSGKRSAKHSPAVPNKNNMDKPAEGVAGGATSNAAGAKLSPAGPAVMVVDGEIVLQQTSMVVDGVAAVHARPGAAAGARTPSEHEMMEVVEEQAQLAAVGASYHSFLPKRHDNSKTARAQRAPQHWTVDDTRTFYEALRQVGPDFGTMEAYFTNRNRRTLKRKYQAELTKNPALVEAALDPKRQKEIDLSIFSVTKADVEAAEMQKDIADAGGTSVEDAPPRALPTNDNDDEHNAGTTAVDDERQQSLSSSTTNARLTPNTDVLHDAEDDMAEISAILGGPDPETGSAAAAERTEATSQSPPRSSRSNKRRPPRRMPKKRAAAT